MFREKNEDSKEDFASQMGVLAKSSVDYKNSGVSDFPVLSRWFGTSCVTGIANSRVVSNGACL